MAFLQFVQLKIEAMVGLFQFAEFCVGLAKPLHNHIVRQHCRTSWLSELSQRLVSSLIIAQ